MPWGCAGPFERHTRVQVRMWSLFTCFSPYLSAPRSPLPKRPDENGSFFARTFSFSSSVDSAQAQARAVGRSPPTTPPRSKRGGQIPYFRVTIRGRVLQSLSPPIPASVVLRTRFPNLPSEFFYLDSFTSKRAVKVGPRRGAPAQVGHPQCPLLSTFFRAPDRSSGTAGPNRTRI